MTNLTKAQREVLQTIADSPPSVSPCHAVTSEFISLGLVEIYKIGYGNSIYQITQAGRDALK